MRVCACVCVCGFANEAIDRNWICFLLSLFHITVEGGGFHLSCIPVGDGTMTGDLQGSPPCPNSTFRRVGISSRKKQWKGLLPVVQQHPVLTHKHLAAQAHLPQTISKEPRAVGKWIVVIDVYVYIYEQMYARLFACMHEPMD